MATEALQQTADRARDLFLTPARELSSLNVEFLEQVTQVQMNSLKQWTDLGLKQARSALEIKDVEGLQQYLQQQNETAKTLGKQAQDDAQKLMELGQDYARKAGELAQNRAQMAGSATGAAD